MKTSQNTGQKTSVSYSPATDVPRDMKHHCARFPSSRNISLLSTGPSARDLSFSTCQMGMTSVFPVAQRYGGDPASGMCETALKSLRSQGRKSLPSFPVPGLSGTKETLMTQSGSYILSPNSPGCQMSPTYDTKARIINSFATDTSRIPSETWVPPSGESARRVPTVAM